MPFDRYEARRPALMAVDVAGRPMPSSPELERGVISAVLSSDNPDAAVDQLVGLLPDHFADPSLAIVYRAILHLTTKGEPVRFRGVINHLQETDRLDTLGNGTVKGRTWLGELVDLTPAIANIAIDGRLLLERAQERAMALACQRIVGECLAGQWSPADWIVWAKSEFETASRDLVHSCSLENLGEIGERRGRELMQIWQGDAEASGLELPWPTLNHFVRGFGLGQVAFIGGLTGSGKTTFMLGAARHIAGREYRGEVSGVCVLSLEMRREELWDRLVCIEAPMTSDELTNSQGFARFGDEPFRSVARKPIEIDDTEKTIASIRDTARRADARLRTYGTSNTVRLHMLAIDHFDLVDLECKPEHIYTKKAELANKLKALAKELDIAIVCLVQMTADASKQDRPPSFADIKGGSALYQIADKILLIDRPWCRKVDKGTQEAKAVKNQANILIAKHRQGQCGSVPMTFDGARSTFAENTEETHNVPHWNS